MSTVYVTGIGIVSPIGSGIPVFWEALISGVNGVRTLQRFDTQWLPVHIGGEIQSEDYQAWLAADERSRLSLVQQIALSACRQALSQASLLDSTGQAAMPEMDIFFGLTQGELGSLEAQLAPGIISEDTAFVPETSIKILLQDQAFDQFAYRVAQRLGIQGRQSVINNACSSGAYAIALASETIRQGQAEMVLCGGVDCISQAFYAGFCALRSMAPRCCQPFDKNRQGVVMGDAAAVLVLESEASVRRRGARPLARLAGHGYSCDAYHLSAPHPEGIGMILCMQRALADAGMSPAAIQGLIAHGTGTLSNDRTEAQAIRHVFGENAPPVTAPKSMLGHSFGAASAVEAIIGILAIQNAMLPPTINLHEMDPECPIDCVANQARPVKNLAGCLTNATSFGGNNISLIWAQTG